MLCASNTDDLGALIKAQHTLPAGNTKQPHETPATCKSTCSYMYIRGWTPPSQWQPDLWAEHFMESKVVSYSVRALRHEQLAPFVTLNAL